MASAVRLAVTAVLAAAAGSTVAQAQTALRLHEPIAASQRPLLCADRGSVDLVLPVMAKAADAQAARDADKSKRLTDIATRLQGEVCRKSAADDVVILRCKLEQVDAGGSVLALVKMSALIQNEAAKGEQSFYGWTDLKVDDAASGAASQGGNARWCAGERAGRPTRQIRVEEREASGGGAASPARETEEPFTPSQDIVLRIQQRLFDFGARIENMDGQLNQETVRSIQQFQKLANLNADGQLTRSTVIKMMTTPAPSPWVAIAFDGFGNFVAEVNRTRRNAEFVALEQLQKRKSSRDPRVSSVAAPNCLGFAVTNYVERSRRRRTNFTQAFTSAGDSLDTAARNAWDYCEREKKGGQCQVRYALCADGSGGNRTPGEADRGQPRDRDPKGQAKRFDPKSIPAHTAPPRFDPKSTPSNTKFDPGSLPLNSQAPQGKPSDRAKRFDPGNIPMNSAKPN